MRTIARIQGRVVAPPVGARGWLAWVENGPDGSRLMASYKGRRPRAVLSDPGLSGLALSGAKALVNCRRDQDGQLLAVDLATGKDEALAPTSGDVSQIAAGDGTVCWVEKRGPAIPGVPFLVAAGPVTLIRSLPETGASPSLVAIVSVGEPPPVSRKPGISGAIDLIGVSSGDIYWAERRSTGTAMETWLRRCAPGDQPETLAVEPGTQAAALATGRLAWTALSQEAAIPHQHAAVKQRAVPDGEIAVLADWLGGDPALFAAGSSLYSQHADALWDLGDARGRQRVIAGGAGALVAAGVIGGKEYLVRRDGTATTIAERPITWWACARRLLGG